MLLHLMALSSWPKGSSTLYGCFSPQLDCRFKVLQRMLGNLGWLLGGSNSTGSGPEKIAEQELDRWRDK